MLSAGDLVAPEAKYHTKCLVKFYNTSRQSIEEDGEENTVGTAHGIALVELINWLHIRREIHRRIQSTNLQTG